jgi:bacterioferritin-associated ferredoxin
MRLSLICEARFASVGSGRGFRVKIRVYPAGLQMRTICNNNGVIEQSRTGRTSMIVCVCRRVSDSQIRQAAADGAHSLECLQFDLGVATQCGRCADCASRVLCDARAKGAHQQHVIGITRPVQAQLA